MKTQTELNQIDIDIEFYDFESIVKGFLMYSVLNRMNEFDFESAFDSLKNPIEQKLIEHAQCSYDDFLNGYYEDIFFYEDSDFEKFAYQTDYIYIDIRDVKEAIAKMHYEKSKEAFDGVFDNLIDLKERVDNLDGLTQEQKVILFDEIIHAQHVTGEIFADLDIDSIKSDLDAELIEIMEITV